MSHHQPPRARLFRPRRGGFTLMELLISSLMVVVLLSALWSLLSMQMRLFESGKSQTEEAHLVRALLAQMERDIQSVIHVKQNKKNAETRRVSSAVEETPVEQSEDSPTEDPLGLLLTEADTEPNQPEEPLPIADDSQPPFEDPMADDPMHDDNTFAKPEKLRVSGLVGTSTSLRLDVLRAADPVVQAPPLERDDLLPPNPLEQLRDLRTVTYQFIAPPELLTEENDEALKEREPELPEPTGDLLTAEDENGLTIAPVLQGLVRRETSWQYTAPSVSQNNLSGTATTGSVPLAAPLDAIASERTLEPVPSLTGNVGTATNDATQSELPQEDIAAEVSFLRFRYYDGSSWRSSWNSIGDGRLPIAIEISLNLGTDDEQELSGEFGSTANLIEEPLAGESGFGSSAAVPSTTLLDESTDMTTELEPTDYRLVVFLPNSEPSPDRSPSIADEGMFSSSQ